MNTNVEKSTASKIFTLLYWFLLASLMFAIFYCSPFSSDDFIFSDIAKNSDETFDKINGSVIYGNERGNARLFGNGLSALLIDNKAVLAIVKTVVFLSIAILLSELLDIRKRFGLTSLVFFFVFFPSMGMFAEVLNLTSGFSNYVPPILMILLIAVLFKKIEEFFTVKIILIAIFGLAAQFFSENSSLFSVFLSVAILIYSIRKKNKKLIIASAIYSFVAIVGFTSMMIIPRLNGKSAVFNNNYRDFSFNIKSVFQTAAKSITRLLRYLLYCVPLWSSLSLSLIYNIRKNDKITIFGKNVKHILIGLLVAGPICGLLTSSAIDEWITPSIVFKKPLDVAIMLLYLISVIISLFKSVKNKELRNRSVAFFTAAIVSYAPLAVVSPVGHRTFYLTYILIVCGVMVLISDILKNESIGYTNAIKCISITSTVFILLQLSVTMYDIHKAEEMRNDYVYQQIDVYMQSERNEKTVIENGKEIIEITIPFLPHQTIVTRDTESYPTFFLGYYDSAKYELRFIKTKWEQWYTDHIIFNKY